MIIRASVRATAHSSKAPCINQSVEGMVVTVLEEQRHHQRLEHVRLEYLPRTPVGHPGDNVVELLLGQNGVKLDWKLLHSNRCFHCVS